MSDRVKLAREIAARTEPRFIEIKPERRPIRKRFVETSPSRGRGRVAFTEAELDRHARRADGRGISAEVHPRVGNNLVLQKLGEHIAACRDRANTCIAASTTETDPRCYLVSSAPGGLIGPALH